MGQGRPDAMHHHSVIGIVLRRRHVMLCGDPVFPCFRNQMSLCHWQMRAHTAYSQGVIISQWPLL